MLPAYLAESNVRDDRYPSILSTTPTHIPLNPPRHTHLGNRMASAQYPSFGDQLDASQKSRKEDLEMPGNFHWPETSQYFLPQTMDPSAAMRLVQKGTKFNESKTLMRPLHYIDVTDQGVFPLSINPRDRESLAAMKTSAMQPGSLRILFLVQRRRYAYSTSHLHIDTAQDEFMTLLDMYMIPPPVVELMYDNNGGSFQHLSYCNDNPQVPCSTPFPKSEPCAYHVCFKLCVWHHDHFVYARYDFHSHTTFFMVGGTSNKEQSRTLVSQFQGQRGVGIFDILLALARFWAQEVEDLRWRLDFDTQTYESRTGYSALYHHGKTPLPPEKLQLRGDMASTRETLRVIGRASIHVGELFKFLQNSLERFRSASAEHPGSQLTKRYRQQLFDALEMRISQQHSQAAQIEDLKARITTQWDIVNAILSHYNNKLTVDMARDSRTDSVLMRRIAFVTIIFLPATFLATFFSMCFFEVNESGSSMRVSRWIWLYVVCTMAFTVLLAWQYAPSRRIISKLFTFRKGADKEQ